MKDLEWIPFIMGLLLTIALWFDSIDVFIIGAGIFVLVGLALLVLGFIFNFGEKKIAGWKIELEEVEYKVEFISNPFKAKSKVVVNDQVQEDVEVVVDENGADYYFITSDYQCMILVRSQEEELKLDLAVEGQSVTTDEAVDFISEDEDKQSSFGSKVKGLCFELVSLIIISVIIFGIDYLFFPTTGLLFFNSEEEIIFFPIIFITFSRFVRSLFPIY